MRKLLVLVAALAMLGGAVAGSVETPLAEAQGVEYVAGDQGMPGGHIVIRGNRLYMGSYGVGMKIYDISNPAAPKQIGQWLQGGRYDAVPDAARFGSKEIAVLNGTYRTQGNSPKSEFFDATDPGNLKLLATFDGDPDGEAHNGEFVQERKLWLPSGGDGVWGLRLYDMSPLLGQTAKPPVRLFAADPVELWKKSPYRKSGPVGPAFSHTHDITVYTDYTLLLPKKQWRDRNGDRRADPTYAKRDIILLAEGGKYSNIAGNTGSVFVIDITNPRKPVVLQRWIHQVAPGHHPIRYNHEAQFLDGDRTLMLVTDEDFDSGCGRSGGIWAIRLSPDLTQSWEMSEWKVPASTNRPICSTHVFSTYKKTVFMGAYNAGLQMIDYSNPRNPQRYAYYTATGSTAWGAYYHKGYVYVGDVSRGLDVLKPTVPIR